MSLYSLAKNYSSFIMGNELTFIFCLNLVFGRNKRLPVRQYGRSFMNLLGVFFFV